MSEINLPPPGMGGMPSLDQPGGLTQTDMPKQQVVTGAEANSQRADLLLRMDASSAEIDKALGISMDSPALLQPASVNTAYIDKAELGNPWFNPNPVVAFRMMFQELAGVLSEIKRQEGELSVKELEMMPKLYAEIAEDTRASAKIEAHKLKDMAKQAMKRAIVHIVNAGVQAVSLGVQIGLSVKSASNMKKLKNTSQQLKMERQKQMDVAPPTQSQAPAPGTSPAGAPKPAPQPTPTQTNKPPSSAPDTQTPGKTADATAKQSTTDAQTERLESNRLKELKSEQKILEAETRQSQQYLQMTSQATQMVSTLCQASIEFINAEDYMQQAKHTERKGIVDAIKELSSSLARMKQEQISSARESFRSSHDQIDKLFDLLRKLIDETFKAHGISSSHVQG